jgi:MFS transporter, ACDE family, multidrug resistance protein
MFQRRIPEWLRHAPTPSVRGVAVLAGTEAIARGILISVFPILMYRAFQDAGLVSQIFFLAGVLSMIWGLLVPWLVRFVPRRWLYTLGGATYIGSAVVATTGGGQLIAVALMMNMAATVTVFVCFNAYVLDYVASVELRRSETLRMFYSAAAWTVGPAGGVWLMQWWEPGPFLVSGAAAAGLLALFWWMRLGNGKLITRARAPAPNPLAYLSQFFAQPRLVAGWLFAVLRSCGWWVYVVYVPVFAIENGLGESVGGTVLSISNAMLFLTPLMLKWAQRHPVRHAVRVGFLFSGLAFIGATLAASLPWLTVALLMAGSAFLVLLDIYGGLPFLMAVKPSGRTEMSAVYSSFRDVSGILTPGVTWLVLLVAPLSGAFAAAGVGLLAAWAIAGRLHPRFGAKREKRVHVAAAPLAPETINDPV